MNIQAISTLVQLILPRPREVFLTKTIQENSYYNKFKPIIEQIKDKFEHGERVHKYLSKRHQYEYKYVDKERELYGMHHLHLGKLLQKGSVERSDYLLIIQFYNNDSRVDFLDISLHKDFTRDPPRYLKIMVEEDIVNEARMTFLPKPFVGMDYSGQ